MKIYLIKHEKKSFNCYWAHVVIANKEEEVRELAKKICADEGEEIWDSARIEHVGESVWSDSEPFVLLSEY